MKVLIVEDTELKYQNLARCVREACPSCVVLHASTAKTGFALLISETIDLVLLDIRLPLEGNQDPHEESSVWFVREVQRKVTGKLPLIVGTSQYPDSLAKVEEQFREYLWTVVLVSADDIRWQRQLSYALRFVQSTAAPKRLSIPAGNSFDVAIITALRLPEFAEVIDALGGGDPYDVQETGEQWMTAKVTCSGGRELSIIAACADSMGMSSMSALVTRLCIAANPKRLILTGIMGGNAERVEMSDIIIVEDSWDYRAGKITTKGFEADVNSQRCNAKMARLLRTVLDENSIISMFRDWKGSKPNALPSVRTGSVACSPAVIADKGQFTDMEDQKRKVLGAEMEAYGCYLAAEQLGDIGPKVLCVKAVCDLGDKNKADLYQRYCAYLSARAAVRLITDPRFSDT